MDRYPKRLIEVDLPIKRISAHARREKDMRRGHVPLLHIWPATRPPAACRAVICAALWPDPADSLCPDSFRATARKWMLKWATDYIGLLGDESFKRFVNIKKNPSKLNDDEELRLALLDFVADFSNWDNSTKKEYLETSRTLTQTAHEALGGVPGSKPLVVDPFAGGGAIPLESLRIGADAFSSDLNPVAVLLNKVTLQYIPKFGERLLNEVLKWGNWLKRMAENELSEFYPKDPDGAVPIAYLWARTIRCEGPNCGIELPLIHSQLLVRKKSIGIALRSKGPGSEILFEIVKGPQSRSLSGGTIRRSSATCPACGYTTPASSVRKQMIPKNGGASTAKMITVVTTRPGHTGRFYRLPNSNDLNIVKKAEKELQRRSSQNKGPFSLVPSEILPAMSGVFNAPLYGHNTWGSLFTPRQALALSTFSRLISNIRAEVEGKYSSELIEAMISTMALVLDKLADMNSAMCVWQTHAEIPAHVFGRWALPMVWDFAEANPLAGSSGSPESAIKRTIAGMQQLVSSSYEPAQVERCSATMHPLPDDCASAFITDPPYYNAIPYADLSDFFYVWLKRTLRGIHEPLFSDELSPKGDEICEMAGWDPVRYAHKDHDFFEREMTRALEEGRRILAPGNLGVVVFAHKSTAGWESQLQAIIEAGWVITGSWPIDTEMQSRLRAKNSATLSSSIHIVCRPREAPEGVLMNEIGAWRDVLEELPKRIHDWMPRLAAEGVVGADAIFACLGPALEIFSRYSRVEKANGEAVTLKEYLEQVWAAVAKEALTIIFTDADATGFEEDARLTAMWLWTLKTGDVNGSEGEGDEEDSGGDEEGGGKKAAVGGFVLEFDAARKIAQGLGAHLEKLPSVVEIKGETARLLSVGERAAHLFGKEARRQKDQPKKKKAQPSLFAVMDEVQEEVKEWEIKTGKIGETVLDRVHQSMILFGAGRGEALRRFLVEDGAGRDQRFWRLAQALSALYPAGTDEKRWVDGVLARKKGLGL